MFVGDPGNCFYISYNIFAFHYHNRAFAVREVCRVVRLDSRGSGNVFREEQGQNDRRIIEQVYVCCRDHVPCDVNFIVPCSKIKNAGPGTVQKCMVFFIRRFETEN